MIKLKIQLERLAFGLDAQALYSGF